MTPLAVNLLFRLSSLRPAVQLETLWRRDFKLGSGLLSFTLRQPGLEAVEAFVAALRFFRLGNSWGAVHSLVAVAPLQPPRAGWLVRLHAGLEDADDLQQDVLQALAAARPGA